MNTTKIRLWIVRETEKARQYSKYPPSQADIDKDCIWIPKSIIEHTSKRGIEHTLDLPDWFIEKSGL